MELSQYHFPYVPFTGAGHRLPEIYRIGKQNLSVNGRSKETAKRHGFEEAINLPQLKLMKLDWYLSSMDSGPKLTRYTLSAAHAPRYPDTLVMV